VSWCPFRNSPEQIAALVQAGLQAHTHGRSFGQAVDNCLIRGGRWWPRMVLFSLDSISWDHFQALSVPIPHSSSSQVSHFRPSFIRRRPQRLSSAAVRARPVTGTPAFCSPPSALDPRTISGQLPPTRCEHFNTRAGHRGSAQCSYTSLQTRAARRARTSISLRSPSLQPFQPHCCIAMTRRCCPSLCSVHPKREAKCRLPRCAATEHRGRPDCQLAASQ